MKNILPTLLAVVALHVSFSAVAQFRQEVKPALTESTYNTINGNANGGQTTENYGMGSLPHMGTLSSTTTVENAAKMANLQIFPNPGRGVFTVRGFAENALTQEITLTVTDMLGRVVHRATITSANVDIQVSLGNSVGSGKYIVELRTPSEVKIFNYLLQR